MTMSMKASERLVRKIEHYDVLTDDERDVLRGLTGMEREIPANTDIVDQGSRPTHSTLLMEGFCGRYTLLPDGDRQITSLHISGDFVDLHSFLIKPMDHAVVSITRCVIVEIQHSELKKITETQPHLTRLLWLSTLTDAAIHREWLVAMGARTAPKRLAHFICETYFRLAAVDRAANLRFDLPMTQNDLGDTLGLTAVHINRTLQDLRGRGLVTWQGAAIEILDWGKLTDFAQFDPNYLSMQQEPR
jgi:CRP-like cAMP-binding protein